MPIVQSGHEGNFTQRQVNLKRLIMKKAISGTFVTFTFGDNLDPVVFNAEKASFKMREYAEMHGWQQRIGDNAAIQRTQKDGTVLVVTEEMRREAVLELVKHYEGGAETWAIKQASGKAQNPTWLAIAEKRGVSYETVAAEKAAADLAELERMK